VLVLNARDLPAVAVEYGAAKAHLPADVAPDPAWPPSVGRSAEPGDLGPLPRPAA
jgi:hypothetical protein